MVIANNADLLSGELLLEGQISRTMVPKVRTGYNADTVPLIFGRAVVFGTANDGDLLLPANNTAILAGIIVSTDTIERRQGYSLDVDGNMGWPVRNNVSYMVEGSIGVKVQTAVTPTSPVFYIFNPSGDQRKGHFRADAGGGTAVQIANARFLKSRAAGGVVELALLLP